MNLPFEVQSAASFVESKAGAWVGIPHERYHKLPGNSNSQLQLLANGPLRYRMTMDGLIEEAPSTHDMHLGVVIHAAGNEGAKLADLVHVRPDIYGPEKKKWTYGANECKAWRTAHQDKPIVVGDELDMIAVCAQALTDDKKAARLMAGAFREVTACARNPVQDTPYLLRCRFDLLNRDDAGWYFCETKSCRDASTLAFSYEIRKRKYHAQAALYRRVLNILTGDDNCRCFLIAIEKDADVPRINVRQLSETALLEGEQILDARLRLLRRCRLSNTWPALADDEGSEHIQMIGLPDENELDSLVGVTVKEESAA